MHMCQFLLDGCVLLAILGMYAIVPTHCIVKHIIMSMFTLLDSLLD